MIAVHSPDKGFNTNPSPDLILEAGHRLVVMGTEKQLDALSSIDSECRIIAPGETLGA